MSGAPFSLRLSACPDPQLLVVAHRQGTGLRCPVIDPRVRAFGFKFDFEYGLSSESVWCAALKCAAADPPGQDTASVDVLITLKSFEWTMYGWGWDVFPPEQWRLERELTIWARKPPCEQRGTDWSAKRLCRVVFEDNQEGQSLGYFMNNNNDFVPKADTNIGIDVAEMRSVKLLLDIPEAVKDTDLVCMWLAVACGATTAPVSAEFSYMGGFDKRYSSGCIPGNMEYQLEEYDPVQTGYTGKLATLPADSLQTLMDSLRGTGSRQTNVTSLRELAGVPAASKTTCEEKYLEPIVKGWSDGDVSAQLCGNNRYLIGLEFDKHQDKSKPSARPAAEANRASEIEEILNLEVFGTGEKVIILGLRSNTELNRKLGTVQEYVRSKARFVVLLDQGGKSIRIRSKNLRRPC